MEEWGREMFWRAYDKAQEVERLKARMWIVAGVALAVGIVIGMNL